MKLPVLSLLLVVAGLAPLGSAAADSTLRDEPLVDLAKAVPGIAIDLRYATPDNLVGKPIYPEGMRCYVRRSVALRLFFAQRFLWERGYGLKIWDAYRPPEAHARLWRAVGKGKWVESPGARGSMHSWGVAVDATLVDRKGRDMPMPTGFDEFTPEAAMHYAGDDPEVARDLCLLQTAMKLAGFMGMRHEWWHFMPLNWREYGPVKSPPPDTRPARISAPARPRS